MSGGRIRTEVTDGIGAILIDREGKRNALTPELCDDLAAAVTMLDRDPEVTVITLAGAGGDFSAGADITELPRVLFDRSPAAGAGGGVGAGAGAGGGSGADAASDTFDHLTAADEAFGAASKPTVALVRGVCMGGGWQLASSCDLVLCSSDARIAITPALLGIVYPRRGIDRLVRTVGADRAKYLLFSGTRISPADAERWGLVTAVIDAESFEQQTASYLARVASNSQYSVHTSKRLIDAGTGPDALGETALDAAWASVWAGMPENADLLAGRPAFLAGRTPEFPWEPPVPV